MRAGEGDRETGLSLIVGAVQRCSTPPQKQNHSAIPDRLGLTCKSRYLHPRSCSSCQKQTYQEKKQKRVDRGTLARPCLRPVHHRDVERSRASPARAGLPLEPQPAPLISAGPLPWCIWKCCPLGYGRWDLRVRRSLARPEWPATHSPVHLLDQGVRSGEMQTWGM